MEFDDHKQKGADGLRKTAIPTKSEWVTKTTKADTASFPAKRSLGLVRIDNAIDQYHQSTGHPKTYRARYYLAKGIEQAIKEWNPNKQSGAQKARTPLVAGLLNVVQEELTWLEKEGLALASNEQLWMKSGSLTDFPDAKEKIDLWGELSKVLTAYSNRNPSPLTDGYLDCGRLVMRDGEKPYFEAPTKGLKDKKIQTSLEKFLLDFLKSNGQLDYIQEREWYISGTHQTAVSINFYPDREFDTTSDQIKAHKDTDSRNLFVNLIFNNTKKMPATEWTFDEQLPNEVRMEDLKHFLSEEEFDRIVEAKTRLSTSESRARSQWEGGTAPPYNYVSWVDELVWHATPIMLARPRFDRASIEQLLFNGPQDDDEEFMLYEAVLVILKKNGSLLSMNASEELKANTNTLYDWNAYYHGTLCGTNANESMCNEIAGAIQTIGDNWANYKQSGHAGQVEVHNNDSIVVPTNVGVRPRRNSINSVQQKNYAALDKMKINGAIPPRSFIRTWVMVEPI